MHLCFLREVPSFRSKLTDKSPLLRLPPSGTQAQSRRTDRLSRRARYLVLTHRRTAEPPEIRGFRVVKRRWVMERGIGWITMHRRPARDYETLYASPEAAIHITSINNLAKRIRTRPRPPGEEPIRK